MLYILIFGVLLFLWFFVLKPYKRVHDNLSVYTGTNGSGKSLISGKDALKLYRKNCRSVFFHNIFHPRSKQPKPEFYSNIGFKISRYKYAKRLTWQHLLLRKKLVPKSVVFVDELSIFLPQYDIDNVNRDILVEFFTFFRHYTKGGYFIGNTQNIKKVNAIVRYCISSVYNLSQMRKFFGLVYLTKCRNLSLIEDTVNVVEGNDEDCMRNIIGIFPLFLKRYDTYTYSERYLSVPSCKDDTHKSLKTGTLMVCPKTEVKALTKDIR